MMFSIFGNISTNDTVPWQPEPTTRGTFGVLLTCLITISLCIWTAVHLNIPTHKGGLGQTLRKFKWLTIGLLAPELVLFTAWYQYIKAKQTAEMLTEYTKQRKDLEDSAPMKERKWTIKEGFYINMGGLAFDTETARGRFLPTDYSRWCFVTHWGLDFLARVHPEVLDSITTSHIEDKNKTNGFGKTLVCIQTLWFMAQCIWRLAGRLPISLLELNTFGHCVCALLIYILWWEKPLEVERPTTIPADRYPKTLAGLWMCTFPSPHTLRGPAEWKHVGFRQKVINQTGSQPLLKPSVSDPKCTNQSEPRIVEDPHEGPKTILSPGQDLHGTEMFLLQNSPPMTLDQIDIERWKLASSFMQAYHEFRDTPECFHALEHRTLNWEFPAFIATENEWLAWGILLFSSLVYGGLHLLAWDVPFRTSAQQMLWRISAAVVTGYGFLVASHSLLIKLDSKDLGGDTRIRTHNILGTFDSESPWVNRWSFVKNLVRNVALILGLRRKPYVFLAWPATFLYVLIFAMSWVAVSIGALVYVASRVFLVVECFISLFNSPADLYKQPSWAPYFPHIG